MKRVFPLFAFLFLILINFASAVVSIIDIFDSINSESLVLVLVFGISFVILFLALGRIIKDNKIIPPILSLLLAFAATYGVYKMDFDFNDWFYEIGISQDTLFVVLPILSLALVISSFIWLKKKAFLIWGGLCILSAFFVYEKFGDKKQCACCFFLLHMAYFCGVFIRLRLL